MLADHASRAASGVSGDDPSSPWPSTISSTRGVPSTRISSSSRSGDADVEAERLHVRPREAGAEACTLQRPTKVPLLAGVAQAGQTKAEPARAESLEGAPDRLGAPDRDDLDAFGVEIPSAPRAPAPRQHAGR